MEHAFLLDYKPAERPKYVESFFANIDWSGKPIGKCLDDPVFAPVLARAEKLNVPIYLHPSITAPSVREAYYSGLPDDAGMLMATAAWGWHYEVSVHLLRLAASGTLDKFQGLKLVVGHMGKACRQCSIAATS